MKRRSEFLLSYYGDDFTGSTDVMEVLAKLGLRTALFTRVPREDQLAVLEGVDAIGITGNTRSLPTEEMEPVLRPVFECLRGLAAPLVHYKVCSTFDSSPTVGSIGRVIEVGARIFGSEPVPIVVGAPVLGRHCVFGNLFARSGLDSEPYRLDRHPTMRQHPVTPMNESDLRLHLADQTDREIALLDVLRLATSSEAAVGHYRKLIEARPGAVLIDLLLDSQLPVVGDVIWSQTETGRSLFVVGSSGVEMALGASWSRSGLAPGRAEFPQPGRAEPLLVLSGSCSPVTQEQTRWALSKGFGDLPLETERFVTRDGDPSAEGRVVDSVVAMLRGNRSVVVHTALGPDDSRIEATRARLAEEISASDADLKSICSRRLGVALGRLGAKILRELELRRVVITGGDTSGHAAAELGIEALEMVAPMAPGSPLCRACGDGSPADRVEFVFKGGQVGKIDLLERTMQGQA